MTLRRYLREIKILFIMVMLFVLLTGCEHIQKVLEPTPGVEDTREQLSIGLVLPMSGRYAISFGVQMEQALLLAKNEINASQQLPVVLEFIREDNRSTVEGAVEGYKKLIYEDGVSVILGPATSSATKETFPIARDNQVVALSPTSAARGLSEISDYVFRIALTTDILVPDGVEATHAKLGYKKVATLYDETDVFSTDGDLALKDKFNSLGIDVVATERFRGGDTNFLEQLSRINAMEPDAVFVSSLAPEKPDILRNAEALGISAPIIIRTLTDAEVEAAGDAAEGVITFVGWGTAIDTPNNQAFIENYTEQTGMPPNNYAARSYTALYVLAEAIKNAESTAAVDIRDALAKIKDFDTVLGKFSFDENGDAIYDPKVLIVRDGKLVLFEE